MKTYTSEELNQILIDHKIFSYTRFSANPKGCRADLSSANLRGVDLSSANLRGAYLSNADLSRANLSRANLCRADLSRADLRGANLSDANLSRADLSDAYLSDANLSGADLSDAYLSDANLSGAYLSNADLSRANLSDAYLSDANLRGADLSNIIGNSRDIVSIQNPKYNICYTKYRLQIGCKNYTISQWFEFTDDEISAMDKGALEWWSKYKDWIKMSIDLNPAV